jgi:hypothetical protein
VNKGGTHGKNFRTNGGKKVQALLMEFEIIEIKGDLIAVLKSSGMIIRETQDALDLMAEASYMNSQKIILREDQLAPAFFDLKSGIAGDILQKFSTYNVRLAIVGDFSKYTSKSLKDFIFESNKYGRINFLYSLEEACEKLGR